MMKNNSHSGQLVIAGMESLGKGQYRLVFDNGIHCKVYASEIRSMNLKEEGFITEEQYHQLITEIIGKRAKKRALHLLERMDRTEHQLREKLRIAEYPEECVDMAIDYVKSYHYLDDVRYASTYTRYAKEKQSRGQIRQKLMAKGISRDLADQAIEEEYDTDESEQIRALLVKKHFDPSTHDDGEFRRVYQFLLRRGFRSSDILREMKCSY